MKLVRTLLTLWKYRKYETVYFVEDKSGFTGDEYALSVNIRKAKLLGLTLGMAFIKLYDGTELTVHRGWITDTKMDAKILRLRVINQNLRELYDGIN